MSLVQLGLPWGLPALGDSRLSRLKRKLRAHYAVFATRSARLLQALPIYVNHVCAAVPADRFYHFSRRDYLCKHLKLGQRSEAFIHHLSVDQQHMTACFHDALYLGPGLELWHCERDERRYSIRLFRAVHAINEGELKIALLVGAEPLHTIGFSWMPPGLNPDRSGGLAPFVVRTQGRWRVDTGPQEQFEQDFPHNSPSYFCYAAMQGIALAVGADHVYAVCGQRQACYEGETTAHFVRAYDGFWEALGGKQASELCFRIPAPFPLKPLSEVSTKHRKRSATRRAHWQSIEAAVRSAFARGWRP